MRVVKAGTVDVSVIIRIIDSTDGTPETGVVWNTAGIDLEYRREGAVSVDITEATLAALTDAHSDGGFLAVGNGYYRLDLPDAACAAGVTGVLIHGTVTAMVIVGEYVQLVAYDPFDGVRQGLTALPNAVAGAASGLPLKAAAGDFLNVANIPQVAPDAAGGLPTTTKITDARLGSLTDWINGGRLDLLLDAIPTTAMRGTDNAALASVCTEARLQALTDWLNGGRLDLLLDAIPTTAMRGTDSAALASAYTAARAAYLDELAAANLPADIDTIKADLPGRITKNVALANFTFLMVLTSDHVTGGTGLTVTAERSIDGAAFAACANAVAEIATGLYKINLAATDLNGDVICLKFTAATADARILTIVTQST